MTWLEGHCISFGQASPFLPLVEQLRTHFQIDELDGDPEIIAKIEQGMPRLGELEAHLPAIRYLLAVDPGDPAFATMESTARRRHLFAALRALPIRGAQVRPLVLVVEDLHWIDTSSEECLTLLLDAVAGVPLLLLVTYRMGYTPPFGSRSFYTTLTLQNFSATETLAMAGHVLGTAQFPAEIHTALLEKAEGVPLFIEEVTKTLLDLGVLQREDGGYRLAKRLSEVNVPETIQGIIMARLDRLGEDGKRTLQLASVIGRQFLVRLLARVAGLSHRLEGLLRELQALEMIYEQGHVPEPAYIFKHAVIQDVAYQSLLMQRRKGLHRAVGEAIEDLYQDRLEEHAAELAYHFVRGEVWEKALAYSRQAGEQALAQSAHREAVGSFEQALSALPHLPEQHDTHEQGIDLRLALRSARWLSSDFGRILAYLREAEALAAALDDPQRLGWVAALMAFYFSLMGDPDRAMTSSQRALAIAAAHDMAALQDEATTHLGHAYYTLGEYRHALDILRPRVARLDGGPLGQRGVRGERQVRAQGRSQRGQDLVQQRRVEDVGGFTEGAQGRPAHPEALLHLGQHGGLLQAAPARHHRGEKVQPQQTGILIVEPLPVTGAIALRADGPQMPEEQSEHTTILEALQGLLCDWGRQGRGHTGLLVIRMPTFLQQSMACSLRPPPLATFVPDTIAMVLR